MPDVPTDIDLDGDSRGGGDLALVASLAQQQMGLDEAITQTEEDLKLLKAQRDDISRQKLPDAMDQAGIKTFTLSNGFKITIKDILTASFPSDSSLEKMNSEERAEALERRERCLEWLNDNGGDPIIKSSVIADFGKGQEEQAKELMEMIRQHFGLDAISKTNIHPASLAKFIKEKLAASVEVPLDDFKVFNGKEAKIIQPPR